MFQLQPKTYNWQLDVFASASIRMSTGLYYYCRASEADHRPGQCTMDFGRSQLYRYGFACGTGSGRNRDSHPLADLYDSDYHLEADGIQFGTRGDPQAGD